jgi:hypothetical protein
MTRVSRIFFLCRKDTTGYAGRKWSLFQDMEILTLMISNDYRNFAVTNNIRHRVSKSLRSGDLEELQKCMRSVSDFCLEVLFFTANTAKSSRVGLCNSLVFHTGTPFLMSSYFDDKLRLGKYCCYRKSLRSGNLEKLQN